MKIKKQYLSLPLTAQLEITNLCNHKCLHCYNLVSDSSNRPIRDVMNNNIITIAQKIINSGVFGIIITGGEPLVKKESVKKIILLCNEKKIKVSINSNITLFDDDFISFIKQNKVRVLTSCPSAVPSSFEKLTGINNFDIFEKNVLKLVDNDIPFTVNMVITRDNLHEIRITAEKMKLLGCHSFSATPMGLNMDHPRLDLLLSTQEVHKVISDLLWVKEFLDLKIDMLEALPKCAFPENILSNNYSFLQRKCQAGRTSIAVSCTGDIRPCTHNPVSYGNILSENLKDIWEKMNDWRSVKYIPDKCKECTWLSRCNGGCRTNAKALSGQWNTKDAWATEGPIEVLPFNNKIAIPLSTETKLKINLNYRYRQENEDAYVIYNTETDNFFMVNKKLFKFINEFVDGETFNYCNLLKKYNISDDKKYFYDVLHFLVQKNIVKIME